MLFSRVIGQEEVAARLRAEAAGGRMPHALLLSGRPGVGKLALALGLAEYLLCSSPETDDACGRCASCRAVAAGTHPDLHFVFPVVKPAGSSSAPVGDQFVGAWRAQLAESAYFDLADWTARLGDTGGKQPVIYAAEAANVQRKLALHPAMGGRRVVVVRWPERMNEECANKLLKILEEPPAGTHFIMASDEPERLLPTVRGRLQEIEVKPLPEQTIARALVAGGRVGTAEEAARVARTAGGSFTAAIHALAPDGEEALFFDLFVMLMRLAYGRRVKDLKRWSEQMAAMGRERQKDFLAYCQRMVRENFAFNFGRPELVGLSSAELAFAKGFARFVNERNVVRFMEELEMAQRDIGQNGNARMVFFDFALQTIVLLLPPR